MHALLVGILLAPAMQAGPAHAMEFWVGSWKCSGDLVAPNGSKTHTDAENTVTQELKGNVIHEHFSMPGMNGESFSVYNPKTKQWNQTWVDDSGGYIPLAGDWKDGKVVLTTIASQPPHRGRMIYSNIQKGSFDWDWMQSTDDGKTWRLAWHLHYTRKGK